MVPFLVSIAVMSAPARVAPTPPMGWNSYDCFSYGVTENEVLDNAKFMAQNLKQFGWNTVVIDYAWYMPLQGPGGAYDQSSDFQPSMNLDKFGRPMPDVSRFPSAAGADGFRKLASEIHAMGLKFGIHLMRGIPAQAVAEGLPIEDSQFHAEDAASTVNKCGWLNLMDSLNMANPASQAYLDSLFQQYASWGVDFVKVDDISNPYHQQTIAGYRKAIDDCGRKIVLSLSPGETSVANADDVSSQANMWRLLGDFWDDWGQLDHAFDVASQWAPYRKEGHWPDLDMLPLGRLREYGPNTGPADSDCRLSQAEQQTMLSLWCITKSPLMFGGDLIQSSDKVIQMISNPEILTADQTEQTPYEARSGKYPVWTAAAQGNNGQYFAVFNRTDKPYEGIIKFVSDGEPVDVRDLWQRRDLGVVKGEMSIKLAPHSSFMALVTRAPNREPHH